MADLDLAINGGTVVNADGQMTANVGIRRGQVVALTRAPLAAARVIDAAGLLVLPGAIDTHVHFQLKQGQGDTATVTEDDYTTGPISAARGGVTTWIDFAIHPRAVPPLDYLTHRMDMAAAGSCIDFAFHAGIVDPRPEILEQFPAIVELGIPSFKFFVTYRKWGFAVDLGFLMAAMQRIRALGGMACLHAEQDEILEWLRTQHAGSQELIYHSLTRPDFSEEIAIYEAAVLARETGCPLYIVHLSTAKGLRVIERARADGVPVLTETCPHYLAFSHDVYREPDGVLYTMTPPLRAPGNAEALWQGLADGRISVVSSDHNALGAGVKRTRPHFLDVPPGLAGTESLLPYLFSAGVVAGKLTVERLVELVSAAPARIYGLPNKGAVRVGYDADLVVWDPRAQYVVRAEDQTLPVGFTIFEGQTFTGRPRQTISQGQVVVDGGTFTGRPGTGRFIERKLAWRDPREVA
jgi:dihydropyrimidinase